MTPLYNDYYCLHFHLSAQPEALSDLLSDTSRGSDIRSIVARSMANEMQLILFDDYHWKINMRRESNTLHFTMRPICNS